MRKILFTILVALGFILPLFGQEKSPSESLVQFTGFVVNADSSKTIPFVTIRIQGTNKGTYSDMQGYFSFVAKKSDVILFSCIGFETRAFHFPQNLSGTKHNTVVTLIEDTFYLPEFVARSAPSPEQFNYMFSRADIPMDELALANQNLRKKPLSDLANGMVNDGMANARWTFNNVADKAYYNGQAQPIPVLDVFAWNRFLQSLQSGKKKRK